MEKADSAFTHVEEKGGRIVAVLGGHGDLEMQMHCSPEGLVSLSAVAISGFRMVRVPRVWDSPERRAAEADPHRELSRRARTFETALSDWTESICALATSDPGPPRRLPTRSLPSPGSTTKRRMMTAARKPRTDAQTRALKR